MGTDINQQYKKFVLDKALKKTKQEPKDIQKVIDEIAKYFNSDSDVIHAVFEKLKKNDSFDNKSIEVVEEIINDGIVENQYLKLIVPFFTNKTNYNQLNNSNFETIDFSSEKFIKAINALFYKKGGHEGAAEIACVYNYIKNDIVNLEYSFEEYEKKFDFVFKDIKLFAFERRINFLVFDVELKKCNDLLPTLCDIADFSSFIC
ncbi:MAG TPA: hypothetical protein VIL26_08565, partial [Clostridia bacterium]